MKKILLSLFLLSAGLTGFSKTVIITNWGAHYTPADTTVIIGDTILFKLEKTHDVVEVDEPAWGAEEYKPLAGGFQLPMGGGMLLTSNLTSGIHFYICGPHISLGMKGTITLLGPSGIAVNYNQRISLFPNPANELISIKTSTHLPGSSYFILDVTGKQVGTGKLEDFETTIKIDRLSVGVYFFQMGLNRKETIRFVKN